MYNPDKFKYTKLKKIVAFLHAFARCDTTSAFFLRGKEKIFKLMDAEENENLAKKAEEFFNPDENIDNLWKIALDIVCILYGHPVTTQNSV